MSTTRSTALFLIVGILLVAPCLSKEKRKPAPTETLAFHELCEGPQVTHAQAKWNCSGRPYTSPDQLQADLLVRFPRGKWRQYSADPALKNLSEHDTWWDCKPNPDETCGFWVRIDKEQFVFLQQLLDHSRNNAWLGIGITTFCGGSSDACKKLTQRAAEALDSSEDYSGFDSMIGSAPPIMPPLPRPPPSNKPAIK